MDEFQLLRQLVETPGPSGNEEAISEVVAELWRPLTDELRGDRLGNLIGVRRAAGTPAGRLLLAAHMDELGLMVKQIVAHPDDAGSGFLRVTNLGGVDRRHLYGQLVRVHGRRELPGVIGGLPKHMAKPERAGKPYDFDEMVVDTGLPAAELRELVAVGDFVSFEQPLRKLLHGRVAGKALDNRASVAALTHCLKALQGRPHAWEVLAVATIQEETGLIGAAVSGFAEQPHLAVAIDVTHAKGPGTRDAGTAELGGGPVIDIGPNVHPGLRQALQDAAARLEMKVQIGYHTRGSGTDAFALQVAREGVPTAVLSIPLRYMHTMVETAALKDITRTGRLLAEFVAGLDERTLATFAEQLLGEKKGTGDDE